ncbi:MAG: hypothetical protein INH07_16555, partial [Cupriavidus sp.]|nr:hypothetical protein [Cupriavidus sp.]
MVVADDSSNYYVNTTDYAGLSSILWLQNVRWAAHTSVTDNKLLRESAMQASTLGPASVRDLTLAPRPLSVVVLGAGKIGRVI